VQVDPNAPVRGPQPWERSRKDTVIALPGEVTRVKATCSTPGQFVWHCHIIDHEDNEMMRLDAVTLNPAAPGPESRPLQIGRDY
jgi:FtsP/CotA-like multicopper oxidase with cupredoxin domain